ncbi:glucose 1-dehydrogenase [Ruminococcaceae bacterium OttesenSCG-928-I18]|nr:glucose 1-dehydrogenase [Ruminococcaceae bacterium OttesenSCG-928-I18]
MDRVKGKVAVVTGGAMGMGYGCAKTLAQEGAKVTILDRSDEVKKTVEELREIEKDAQFYQVDVSNAADMKKAYDEVAAKFGTIDISVNAAGLGEQKYFLDVDEAFLDKYLNVNFKGIWNACHSAIPYMVKQEYGKIVNFSSVTGITVVDPGMTHYASTKGAIMGLTKALASEFADKNITVNAILPGMVRTPMAIRGFKESDPDNWEQIAAAVDAAIPMKRMGTIEEAGKVALFLSSDDSSYVTGQGLIFDGGSTLPEMQGSGWEPND